MKSLDSLDFLDSWKTLVLPWSWSWVASKVAWISQWEDVFRFCCALQVRSGGMDDLLKADNWGSVEISDIGPFKSLFSAVVEGERGCAVWWIRGMTPLFSEKFCLWVLGIKTFRCRPHTPPLSLDWSWAGLDVRCCNRLDLGDTNDTSLVAHCIHFHVIHISRLTTMNLCLILVPAPKRTVQYKHLAN